MEYLAEQDAGTFDLGRYLAEHLPDQADDSAELRRIVTRLDPLLFALLYCPELIKGPDGRISLADLHLDLCRYALSWIRHPGPREARHAFVAPRECGKSTWLFLIIPLWAAAHGHARFIAAFSSSGTQAMIHLAAFKLQLDTNKRIRSDFPKLCHPAMKSGGTAVANTQEIYHSQSGFTFAARGIDAEVLGLVDPLNRRPDTIVLDDIEPDESNYSVYQKGKRLGTVISTVLAMNERAQVALVGTVTMPGSIIHELVETVTTKKETPKWIKDERFKVRYYPPIVQTSDGERSCWPGKWSLGYLHSIQNTQSYRKNFENRPVREGGIFWVPETFRYGLLERPIKTLLEIDPAVTDTDESDQYGLSVIQFDPGITVNGERKKTAPPRCCVLWCRGYRFSPAALRNKVIDLLDVFPEINRVRIEVNQGGDTWKEILHDLPVRLLVHHESVPKKVRAKWLLNRYERGQVLHAEQLPDLETQLLGHPFNLHDDLIDATAAGTAFFLASHKARVHVTGYL